MSNLTNLIACVSSGLILIPMPLGHKGPTHKGWGNPASCFSKPEDFNGVNVDQWNWGVHHLASNTCAIDIDDLEIARWKFLEHGIEIDALIETCLGIHSGNPGHAKLFFRLPEWLGPIASKQLTFGEGDERHAMIDFRCASRDLLATKQDVLPGSWHPTSGQYYQWHNDHGMGPGMLQEIPGTLLQMWLDLLARDIQQVAEEPSAASQGITPEMAQDALNFVSPDSPRDDWVETAMALHHIMGDAGYPVFDAWSAQGNKYAGPHDTGAVWRSIHVHPGGITFKSLWSRAAKAGWKGHLQAFEPVINNPTEAQQSDALLQRFRALTPMSDVDSEKMTEVDRLILEALQFRNPTNQERLFTHIREELHWSQRRLDRQVRFLRQQGHEIAADLPGVLSFPFSTENGAPKDHSANLRAICDHKQIIIRHNRMSHDIEIHDPEQRDWLQDEKGTLQRAHIKDLCVANNMPHGRAHEHINTLGCANSYHPMEDYLAGHPWDGRDWFQLVADTVTVKDKPLWEMTLKKWAISACACARELTGSRPPRGVLVMTGRQLIGKTSWFRYLTPDRSWFGEGLHLDPKDKDSVKKATKYSIVELGELDATFKAGDLSRLKAFISSPYDEVRLPYAATESKWPRRTVFCGTVNDPAFLEDRTGNTRFWVNDVDGIDLDTMEELSKNGTIAQFWAQVNHWLDTGESWDLDTGEARFVEENNDSYMSLNQYEALLEDYFEWPDPAEGTAPDNDRQLSITEWCPVNPMSLTDIAHLLGMDISRSGQSAPRALKEALMHLTGQSRGALARLHTLDLETGGRDVEKRKGRWYYMPYPRRQRQRARVVQANFGVIDGGTAATAEASHRENLQGHP